MENSQVSQEQSGRRKRTVRHLPVRNGNYTPTQVSLQDLDDLEEIASSSNIDGSRSAMDAMVRGVDIHTSTIQSAINQKNVDLNKDCKVDDPKSDFILPGNASVYVKTWGCGHNNSDGEYMAGLLASHGYNVLLDDDKKNDADVWLLNSCTVKGPSEQTFINDINKSLEQGKKVVLAGCVPQAAPNKKEFDGLSVIGVQQIDKVVDVVEETLKGNSVRLMKTSKREEDSRLKSGGANLNLPKIRRNKFIEIIPINTGCLNNCTYCKTKHARGDLGSYSIEEITARVDQVLSEGIQEVWLTSEDTGAYGRDIECTIVDLLESIVKTMEQHANQTAMLRVGMTNPPYILELLAPIKKFLLHDRVFSFLHVPVQSGSNKVLEDMKRAYTHEEFRKVADFLAKDINLATDIICGFPTETEEDFEETMSLCSDYNFPVLHISQFYPRPGTPAARMQRVPTNIVKQRSRRLTTLFNSYSTYSHMEGQVINVLFTDTVVNGSRKQLVGHDKRYIQVLVPYNEEYMGMWCKVKIDKTSKWSVEGTVDSIMEISNNVGIWPIYQNSNDSINNCNDSGLGSSKHSRSSSNENIDTEIIETPISYWGGEKGFYQGEEELSLTDLDGKKETSWLNQCKEFVIDNLSSIPKPSTDILIASSIIAGAGLIIMAKRTLY